MIIITSSLKPVLTARIGWTYARRYVANFLSPYQDRMWRKGLSVENSADPILLPMILMGIVCISIGRLTSAHYMTIELFPAGDLTAGRMQNGRCGRITRKEILILN